MFIISEKTREEQRSEKQCKKKPDQLAQNLLPCEILVPNIVFPEQSFWPQKFSTRGAFLVLFFSFLGRLLCIRKTYTKMDQIRFSRVFSILWVREWSRFVWPNPFEFFVPGLQPDLVPKSVCSSDTNLQTDFARGTTITTFGQ